MTWPDIRDDLDQLAPTHLTTRQLAKRYGLTVKQMDNLLRHYGFLADVDYGTEQPHPPPVADWDAIDWTFSDMQLAKAIGCDRSTVTRQRAKRGDG